MNKYAFLVAMFLFMISGFAGAEITWDSGHREYSEGRETWVYMHNDASVDVTGGWIGELNMFDDTATKVTGGEVGIIWGGGTAI